MADAFARATAERQITKRNAELKRARGIEDDPDPTATLEPKRGNMKVSHDLLRSGSFALRADSRRLRIAAAATEACASATGQGQSQSQASAIDDHRSSCEASSRCGESEASDD